jgi:hypothetical protein
MSHEYILDKKAPDTRSGQCLQGFRALKKPSIMEGGFSTLCVKMRKQSKIMKENVREKTRNSQNEIPFLVLPAPFRGHSVTVNPCEQSVFICAHLWLNDAAGKVRLGQSESHQYWEKVQHAQHF